MKETISKLANKVVEEKEVQTELFEKEKSIKAKRMNEI